MKKFIIIILATLFAITGCKDETIAPDNGGGNTLLPDGRVRFTLVTDVPPIDKPLTRVDTADENAMASGNFWVFVFDSSTTPADPTLLEIAQAAATTSTIAPYKWVTTLKTYNHPVKIVLIANAPATVYNSAGGSPKSFAKDMFSIGTKYSVVESAMYTALVAGSNATINYVPYTVTNQPPATKNIPMCIVKEFTELTTQTNLGTDAAPIRMPRIAAKVTVDYEPANSLPTAIATEFSITGTGSGASMRNTRNNSCIFPRSNFATPASVCNYTGTDLDMATLIAPATKVGDTNGYTTDNNPIYIYECSDPSTPYVIVKATYKSTVGFYKLTFLKQTGGDPITQINRNTHYRFIITEATGAGYTTSAQAITAPPSNNIKWRVDISDLTSHDIIDNGQYYIAVSNSEYRFYSYEPRKNVHVVTINHNFPAAFSNSASASLEFDDVIGGLRLASSDKFNVSTGDGLIGTFTNCDGTNKEVNIYMDFGSAFKTFPINGANLVITCGNLSKKIRITRRAHLPYNHTLLKDFNDPTTWVVGEITTTPTPEGWIGLSTGTSLPGLNHLAGQGMQPINVVMKMNDIQSSREVEAYFSRSTNEGRLKAILQQGGAIEFVSTDVPEEIGRFALASTFTFENKFNIPFKVKIAANDGSATVVEQDFDAQLVHSLTIPALPAGILNGERKFTVYFQYAYEESSDIWIPVYEFTQTELLTVRILSVGINAMSLPAHIPRVQLGTAAGEVGSFSNGIAPLVNAQFTTQLSDPERPVKAKIIHYHLYNGNGNPSLKTYEYSDSPSSSWYNIGEILKKYKINILYATVPSASSGSENYGPTAKQAKEVVSWLTTKNTGLIYCGDWNTNCNKELSIAIFGQSHTRGNGNTFSTLKSDDSRAGNDTYRAIMGSEAPYNKYTDYPAGSGNYLLGSTDDPSNPLNEGLYNKMFEMQSDYMSVTEDMCNKKKFMPLLYNGTSVGLAVSDEQRIVFLGELQWFDGNYWGGGAVGLNTDGSLRIKNGKYTPRLVANLWYWFIMQVALHDRK